MHATITVLIFVGVLFFVFFCFFVAHEWRNVEGAVGGRQGGRADWRTGTGGLKRHFVFFLTFGGGLVGSKSWRSHAD